MYANYAFATSTGSPPSLVAGVLNAYDGPANGGVHTYANWNFAPNLIAGDLASRTVAATLQNYRVPAMVAVETGAHWITVNGVSTNGAITRNGNYTINGFFVQDPWTGLALTNPAMAAAGGLGLGVQTYLRYGVDNLGGGNFRLAPWFQYFNPTSARSSPANAYSIVVEPQGPEAPDTVDPNATTGDPSGIPVANILGSDLTSGQAATDAGTDLTSDIDSLDNLPGLTGGSLDTTSADDAFVTLPGDTGLEGDWLIPCSTPAPAVAMSPAASGSTPRPAWWMRPLHSPAPFACRRWTTMANDQSIGLLPNDNSDVLPEPPPRSSCCCPRLPVWACCTMGGGGGGGGGFFLHSSM